jgi:calcium-dependent protein kinase
MGGCASTEESETDSFIANVQAAKREEWQANYSSSVRSQLVVKKTNDINDDYCILYEAMLGKGGCGVVYAAEYRNTDQPYAIKVCHKDTNDIVRLDREINLLKDIDHTNVIRLFSVYKSDKHVNLVMELCTGGHLGSLIQSREKFNFNKARHLDEEWSKLLCRQLLSAVRHMHERGICHRDIKLQNILLDKAAGRKSQIKLIDFGYGSRFIGVCPMTTNCGTPYTTAPEVLRKSYDERCDIWSIGVVLFIMLSGTRPFPKVDIPGALKEAGKTAMITNILAGRWQFIPRHWNHVTKNAQEFVQKLLHPIYKERLYAHEAMDLPWIRERTDKNAKIVEASIRLTSHYGTEKMPETMNNTNGFGQFVREMSIKMNPSTGPASEHNSDEAEQEDSFPLSEDPDILGAVGNILKNHDDGLPTAPMRRTGNMALAFGLHDSEIHKMRDFFQSIDVDSSGTLCRSEFKNAIQLIMPNNEITPDDCDIIFSAMDVNGDDQISFTEFLAATLNPELVDIEALSEAFNLLDGDGDGFISMSELKRMYSFKFMKKGYGEKAATTSTKTTSENAVAIPAFEERQSSQDLTDAAAANEKTTSCGIRNSLRSSTLDDHIMAVMASCDTDMDGRISYDEFIFAMTGLKDYTENDVASSSGVMTPRNDTPVMNVATEQDDSISGDISPAIMKLKKRLSGIIDAVTSTNVSRDVSESDISGKFSNINLNPQKIVPLCDDDNQVTVN